MKKINFRLKLNKKNRGMSYVELIVVLAIFSIMSGVVLYNYQDFNKGTQIKSLSNDVALKIVETQKLAMSGTLVDPERQKKFEEQTGFLSEKWRPSYGLFFDSGESKSFLYFADLDDSAFLSKGKNPAYNLNVPKCDSTECLDRVLIGSDYYISSLQVFYPDCVMDAGGAVDQLQDPGGSADQLQSPAGSDSAAAEKAVVVKKQDAGAEQDALSNFADNLKNGSGDAGVAGTKNFNKAEVNTLSVTFTRPDSKALIQTVPYIGCPISYAYINLSSSSQKNAKVTVYSSGRIQLN